MRINWQYGKRRYIGQKCIDRKNHTMAYVDEMRDARWYYDKDGREVLCFKAFGSTNVYVGDIVRWQSRIHYYIYDDKTEEYVKVLRDDWAVFEILLVQNNDWHLGNNNTEKFEILGNAFEHPYLLQKVGYPCLVDGVVERIGCPRIIHSREEYYTYIQSNKWKRLKARVIKDNGCKCIICCKGNVPIHVHHLTYERFGYENEADLIPLCKECHNRVHDESDEFYLRLAELNPMDRVVQPDYRKMLELFFSMFGNKPYKDLSLLFATIFGLSKSDNLMSIILNNESEFDVKWFDEGDLEEVLKIADSWGCWWFDESNKTASYGFGEALTCSPHQISFHGAGVDYYNPVGKEITSEEFFILSQFLNHKYK